MIILICIKVLNSFWQSIKPPQIFWIIITSLIILITLLNPNLILNQERSFCFSSDIIYKIYTENIIKHIILHKCFHNLILIVYELLWTFLILKYVYDWTEHSIQSASSPDLITPFLLIIYSFHSFLHSVSSSMITRTTSMMDESLSMI